MNGDLKHGLSKRTMKIAGCALAAYMIILGCIFLFSRMGQEIAEEEAVGTLSGRFAAVPSITYHDVEHVFRQGEIKQYLLIGVDAQTADAETAMITGQADFMLLLTVDRAKRSVTPLMVDRDTMAEIQVYGVFGDPAGTREMQICLAQAFRARGSTGSANTVKAVSRLLYDIPIDGYLALDMTGIQLLNDSLGGVTVTMAEDFSHLDPAMTLGAMLQLQGRQAELFVRSRTLVSDGTNASRMRRQRQYLDGLLALLTEKANEDMETIGELFDTLEGHMETDMTRGQILNELYACQEYEQQGFRGLVGTRKVNENGFVEFYADTDAKASLMLELCFD